MELFFGTAHVKIDGNLLTFDFDTMEVHIVLHGTEAYEGQVLNLKMDWDTSDMTTFGYKGTWLKPCISNEITPISSFF